jgi:hypothetical protein
VLPQTVSRFARDMCSFRPVKAEQFFTDQNLIFLDE